MKIIKQGLIPEEVVYRTTCTYCDTEFEFEQKEGTVVDDQRDGTYVSIACPVCFSNCSVAYLTPRGYMRLR